MLNVRHGHERRIRDDYALSRNRRMTDKQIEGQRNILEQILNIPKLGTWEPTRHNTINYRFLKVV